VARYPTEELIICLLFGTTSKYWIHHINIRFYVHGGQDLKEGSFGDMWKLNIDFLNKGALDKIEGDEEIEVENIQWRQVTLSGKYPASIAHH
jgi:hypothetical protein